MKPYRHKKLYSMILGILVAVPLSSFAADQEGTILYGKARLSVDQIANGRDGG